MMARFAGRPPAGPLHHDRPEGRGQEGAEGGRRRRQGGRRSRGLLRLLDDGLQLDQVDAQEVLQEEGRRGQGGSAQLDILSQGFN